MIRLLIVFFTAGITSTFGGTRELTFEDQPVIREFISCKSTIKGFLPVSAEKKCRQARVNGKPRVSTR